MGPGRARTHEPADGGTAPEVFARFRAHDWIGNSRNTADEDVIRTLASMAGFTPASPTGQTASTWSRT